MKLADKNKKEKPLTGKTPLHTQTKKIEIKKITAKKQQEHPKKSTSFIDLGLSSANLTKATSSGLSSGTQTSKYSQLTTKVSGKASLAQIRELKECQSHKVLLSSKSKGQKQKSEHKPIQMVNNFIKPASKPIIVDKAKQQIKKSLANVIKSYYPIKKTCLDISMTEATKDATQKDQKIINATDFSFLEVIGEGGYGKVWKVEQLKTRKQFAMKQMSKAAIIMKKSVDNVLNERKILQKLRHEFIANMHFAFNDRDNLYLVMDLLAGGDLRYHIGRVQKFNQQQTKFLVACIIVAIEYIHKMKIFHRDIKPENLVFDEFGYLKLTDFGIARVDCPSQTLDASGTPGYMAPEVLCKQVHSYPVDFYALGIITYQLIMGKVKFLVIQRPYHGNNRNQIRDAILSKQHALKKTELPAGYKIEAVDFVNKLIIRQPASRLGAKQGAKELKSHPWLKGFNWAGLMQRKLKSPFKGKFMMEVEDKMNEDEMLMQYKLLQKADQKIDPFAKYYFQQVGERQLI